MSIVFLVVGLLTLLCASNAACFEVPKEWKESIRALCRDAEKGIFPHPSPHAQTLHGTIQPQAQQQVHYIHIRIFSATVHNVRLSYKFSTHARVHACHNFRFVCTDTRMGCALLVTVRLIAHTSLLCTAFIDCISNIHW